MLAVILYRDFFFFNPADIHLARLLPLQQAACAKDLLHFPQSCLSPLPVYTRVTPVCRVLAFNIKAPIDAHDIPPSPISSQSILDLNSVKLLCWLDVFIIGYFLRNHVVCPLELMDNTRHRYNLKKRYTFHKEIINLCIPQMYALINIVYEKHRGTLLNNQEVCNQRKATLQTQFLNVNFCYTGSWWLMENRGTFK